MRKWLTYIFLFLVGLGSYFVVVNYPYTSEEKQLQALCDTSLIAADLHAITGHTLSRNYLHPEVLDSVAAYIQQQFMVQGALVNQQYFEVEGRQYQNVIASFGPADAPRIIIGAHYDVAGKQEGADDNASGVAGILALGRLLKGKALTHRIDLVAYSLEEPPYFGTEKMGSYIHAKSLKDQKIPVRGMISVEMIGYFSDSVGSQDYPIGWLSALYGDKGDYITVVKKTGGGDFAKQFKEAYFNNNTLPAKAFAAPSFFGGIDLSDHRNYWHFGFSAVMITNTAFYRNHQYHLSGDTMDRLDIRRMALVVDGLYRAIIQMQ
ncbi:MAG: M28 family peptidase [Chitinophagaceae bacterium]